MRPFNQREKDLASTNNITVPRGVEAWPTNVVVQDPEDSSDSARKDEFTFDQVY